MSGHAQLQTKRAVLTVLLVAAVWACGEDAKPEDWAVTPLLPGDSILVVTIKDSSQAIAQFQKTGLWQIYSNPDVQRTFRGQLSVAQMGIVAAEMTLGFKLTDVLSYFSQGEITVAVLGLDKKTPRNMPLPDLLISVQSRGQTVPFMNEINMRLDQLKAAGGGQIVGSQAPLGNYTINKLAAQTPELGPVTICYAEVDGSVLFTVGEGRIERILAMREKFKGAPPKPVDGQEAEVLAQNPAFAKAIEKSGPETALMGFLNFAAVIKNPLFDALPKTEQQKREWQAAGLEGVRGVAFGAGFKDKIVHEVFYLDAPAATRKGLLGLLEGESLTPAALAAAPQASLAAGAVHINPEKILDRLLEIAAVEKPTVRQELEQGLAAINAQLNVDVKKELFNALTGEAVLSFSIVAKNPKLPISFPQPLLTLGVKDLASLKRLLNAVTNVGKENNFDFTNTPIGETEIITARERSTQGRDPGQIAYAICKNDLIVSIFPLAIREELRRRGSASAAGNSLSDDADFKAARAKLAIQPQALAYLDTGALAVAAYDALIPLVQLRERTPQVDVNALPTSDVLMQNLSGSVVGFSADADGIVVESASPTGFLAFSAIIPPALIRKRRAQQQAVAAEQNAQGNRIANALARDLKAYAAENNGNYPATLLEMRPKYLADVETEALAQVVYRGKQDAPNKIVAHSSEKNPGPILVLLQDGSIVSIGRREFGKAIIDGYTGPKTPPPASTEPVKPPKPPDF